MQLLLPQTEISPQALAAGQRQLVHDAAWASVTGALSGGVVLVAFALMLGAGPLTIGLLAAIPFAAQVAQLPAIQVVERVRQRKRIGVIALTAARVLILCLALLPFAPADSPRLTWLVLMQFAVTALSSFAACAVNAWFHQLLPTQGLGTFFAKRLVVGTALASLATLAAGLWVDHTPFDDPLQAYALAFAGAGLAGLLSSLHLARTPEPLMRETGPTGPLWPKLKVPFKDANFRSLLLLIGSWNFATNLAAPFLAVYLIRQLGYGLSTVTGLWVASQAANALTLFSWGRVSAARRRDLHQLRDHRPDVRGRAWVVVRTLRPGPA